MKKIFVASFILLVVVLLFLGIYNFAFKKEAAQTAEQKQAIVEEPKTSKNLKEPSKLTVVSDEAVLSPFFDKKSETITYYSAKDGTVWKINPNGKGKQQISDVKLDGLKNVYWSPDHSKVVTMFEKNGQITFFEYDYALQKGLQLKSGLDTVVWDNLGTKIFYKYYDAGKQERTLNIANPDGSGWQKITDLEFKNVSIAPVPSTAAVSYWNYPSANEKTKFYAVSATGGEPKVVLGEKYGADYLWSPDGTQALVSSLSDKDRKMTALGIVSAGGEYKDLGIPTLVSKCVWSIDGKTIYYALPGDIPDSAVMPDDYQNKKFFTDDTYWKMDVATGKKERIIDASSINGKHDSTNLFLSATEDALYFVNRVDGKLYKIDF